MNYLYENVNNNSINEWYYAITVIILIKKRQK